MLRKLEFQEICLTLKFHVIDNNLTLFNHLTLHKYWLRSSMIMMLFMWSLIYANSCSLIQIPMKLFLKEITQWFSMSRLQHSFQVRCCLIISDITQKRKTGLKLTVLKQWLEFQFYWIKITNCFQKIKINFHVFMDKWLILYKLKLKIM